MMLALAVAGLLLALVPATLFLANLPLFQLPRWVRTQEVTQPFSVSVLIPARDEEAGIEACVRSVLASEGVDVEVLVLDDHSSDRTAEIVQRLAREDQRVRYLRGEDLPSGWNGKQFACFQLARQASTDPGMDDWVFLDADVRLERSALRDLLVYRQQHAIDLLSAFPHQQTGSWLEVWLVPMMHVILLGYLPIRRMRASRSVAYAAGCGQLFVTTPDAYRRAGTHEGIRMSRHDGLKLPRLYRSAGLVTDVIDGTLLASCRMYHSANQVVRGLLKNAHEGIANRRLILPFSVLLLGSAVLPLITLLGALMAGAGLVSLLSLAGVVLGHLPRAVAAVKFRQSFMGVVFHAPATLLFVILQWLALVMHARGRSVPWRGRIE